MVEEKKERWEMMEIVATTSLPLNCLKGNQLQKLCSCQNDHLHAARYMLTSLTDCGCGPGKPFPQDE